MIGGERPSDAITALAPRRLWTHRPGGDVRDCRGVILFADIAGFTRLTETAKRRAGTRGIEELTARLNAIFGDLVGAALDADGDILKFGGDAILVAFDAGGRDREAVKNAIRCAAAMQQAMVRHRRTTLRSLSLHLGMAHGEWCEYVAGIPGSRREHFVWGLAITRAMAAADSSRRQARIDCPADLLPRGERLHYQRVAPRLYDFSPVPIEGAAGTGIRPQTDLGLDSLWDFIPEALRTEDRSATFNAVRPAEHRRVATLFGFWKCPKSFKKHGHGACLLEDVFRCVHQAQITTDGLWARSDPSSDKQKILILFGATQSKPDDVDRALACAAELQEGFSRLRESHPSLRLGIGVTTATVFTGFVGNERRREFTAMGDGVNLAARLAAKAGAGATLVDATTKEEATRYRLRPAGVLTLKNVRKPTAVFRPDGLIDLGALESRDDVVEHPRALQRCAQLWDEGASTIRLLIQSGADARKFTAQFFTRLGLPENGRRILVFDPSHASHPLGGVRHLLDVITGGDTAFMSAHSPDSLRELLDPSGNQAARLLARLGPEGASREVARQFLQITFPSALIVLDHLETLGELDRQVIETVANGARVRWLLIEHADTKNPRDGGIGNAVTLGALPRDEFVQVLNDILAPDRPSRSLIDFLHKRSAGTVRLARAFLSHLIAQGAATRSGGSLAVWQLRDADSVKIPDGLRAHYLQHVDRLPLWEQLVLRAIALLGDSAPREAAELLCTDISRDAMSGCIAHLQTQRLIELRVTDEDVRLSVTDPTCRQAVYETMSYQLRESWHRCAAAYWRTSSQPDPGRVGEHLFRARDPLSARWLARAARRAQRFWSLDRARLFSRWAILAAQGNCDAEYAPICPPLKTDPTRKQTVLFDSLAEILRLQGLHSEAGRIHCWLARVAAQSKDRRSSCHHRLIAARMDWYAGHYEKSGRQALAVLRQSRRLRDQKLIAQSAFLLGETCRRTGRVDASLKALTEAESLLRRSNNRELHADVLNALGLVHWNCGRLDEAHVCFEQSLGMLGRHGDPSRRGQVANNLGILHEEQGDLRLAERYYGKAFTLFDRTGIRRHRAYSLGNLANLHRHAARYERARAAYEEVETELRAMGEAHAAAYTIGNLGDLARDFGDLEAARSRYEAAMQFAIKAGDEELKSECHSRLALLSLLEHHPCAIPRHLRAAHRAAATAKSREFSLHASLVAAEFCLYRSEATKALDQFEAARKQADDACLLYYQLWAAFGVAKTLAETAQYIPALRLAMRTAAIADRAGYRWWRFHSLVLAVRLARHLDKPSHSQLLTEATALRDNIEAGIGDDKIKRAFALLPVIRRLESTSSVFSLADSILRAP